MNLMKDSECEELLETLINGNIAYFKETIRSLSKRKLVGFIEYVFEQNDLDICLLHIRRAFE